MASRTSTDPLEILLEMGVDLDNLSEEEDYLSALMEAVNTLQIKNAGDDRIGPLQQEIRKVRQKRKAADPKFKARKTKISAGAFKRGSATGSNVAPKALPTGAIVSYQKPEAEEKKEEKKKGSPKNLILEISETVTRIADILKDQYKLKRDTATFDRKKAEREKRDLQKKNLAKRFEGLKRVAEKLIAPVRGIFDRIMGFLFNIILGKFLIKLVEWFSNPDNQGKIKSIIRFLTNNWPKLLSAYIVFGTGLGKFSRFLVKILARGAVRLAAATTGLLARLFGARALGKFSRFFGRRGKVIAGGIEAVTTIIAFKALENAFTKGIAPEESASIDNDIPVSGYQGGGMVGLPGMGGGGGGTNALTNQAKSRSLLSVLSDPFGNRLRKKQFNDPQNYLTDKEYQNRKGYEEGGEVDGPGGIDKVPAMLTDGEFVMSRGAVQKYGVSQLEAMNAAGGGTNVPKVMNGTVYAKDGGYVSSGDPRNYQRTPDVMAMMEAFLAEAGKRFPWAAKIVDPSFYGRALNEAGKFVPNIDTDFIPRAINEGVKLATPAFENAIETAMRVGGEIENVARKTVSDVVSTTQSAAEGIKNFVTDPEALPSFMGFLDSGIEAIPAIAQGFMGIQRTDTSISKAMQRGILDAKASATARGSSAVRYEDYAGDAGGIAGKYTMGQIADDEFLRDAQGRIVGITQNYDTNRPAEEAFLQGGIARDRLLGIDTKDKVKRLNDLVRKRMTAEGATPTQIKNNMAEVKEGGFSFGDLKTAIYKPFEGLLDVAQKQHGGRGSTRHEIIFDKDVLGFEGVEAPPKPGSRDYEAFKAGGGMAALNQGKNVRQIVVAGRPLIDNERKLEAKRPWWDKFGSFGGATAEMKRQQDRQYTSAPGGIGPTLTAAQLSPNQQPNVSIPSPYDIGMSGAPNVTVIKTSSKDKSPSENTGGSEVPNANPGQGNRAKWNILGMSVPALF